MRARGEIEDALATLGIDDMEDAVQLEEKIAGTASSEGMTPC